MGRIRNRQTDKYSIISKEILWDKRLSAKARFLLIFCLALADNWEFSEKGLAFATGIGVTALKSSIKELETAGYLHRERIRAKNGQLEGADYVFYDKPCTDEKAENPMQEEPTSENLTLENPQQLITNRKVSQRDTFQQNTNITKYQGNCVYTGEQKTAPQTAQKHGVKYADNVTLTEDEYQKLLDRLGSKEAVDECIEILDSYKGAHGVKYKSDYKAILNWVIERYTERVKKRAAGTQQRNDVAGAAAKVSDMLERGGFGGFFD